jgi:hypothetical protein
MGSSRDDSQGFQQRTCWRLDDCIGGWRLDDCSLLMLLQQLTAAAAAFKQCCQHLQVAAQQPTTRQLHSVRIQPLFFKCWVPYPRTHPQQ